ncbi:hypothetical protein CEP51_002561 [Fusarium floridanum]|uniref:Uncharacterized protein n=2 Tax=Fusarium solani species complex TaxID=232080 RepID=A0A428SAU4_9HYPO|nr:hypothetical protein CEP51_002561 [Fusarium floridanum]RSM17075.1 hypothetical protein CDV31_004133 [Fusarium ambrosium]
MRFLKVHQIQDVAVLVDKYQMADRFTFAGGYWLRQGQTLTTGSIWGLMTAAYLLKLPRTLYYYSNLLVAKKEVTLTKYAFQMPDRMLGLKFCS